MMKPFNKKNIEELIKYVDLTCEKPEGLLSALNIAYRGFLELPWGPKIKQQLKESGELVLSVQADIDAILQTIILFQYEQETLNINETDSTTVELALYRLLEKRDFQRNTIIEIQGQVNNDTARKKVERLNQKTILVGDFLPRLYATYFCKEWGISRPSTGGIPYGPGIRFIEKSMNIMSQDTNPENIYAAYRAMKKLSS